MKSILSLSALLLFLNSCLSLNPPVLYTYNDTEHNADFSTYHITTNERLSSEVTNAIEAAIRTKMNALGYQSSAYGPDLHIYYEIFEDNFTTRNLAKQRINNSLENNIEKLKKIRLKHGAICISLFNKAGRNVVWRGFSDGYSLNPRIVKSKAYKIMDHYQLLAARGEKIITAQ